VTARLGNSNESITSLYSGNRNWPGNRTSQCVTQWIYWETGSILIRGLVKLGKPYLQDSSIRSDQNSPSEEPSRVEISLPPCQHRAKQLSAWTRPWSGRVGASFNPVSDRSSPFPDMKWLSNKNLNAIINDLLGPMHAVLLNKSTLASNYLN